VSGARPAYQAIRARAANGFERVATSIGQHDHSGQLTYLIMHLCELTHELIVRSDQGVASFRERSSPDDHALSRRGALRGLRCVLPPQGHNFATHLAGERDLGQQGGFAHGEFASPPAERIPPAQRV
jgi:hypothetical protein